MDSAERRVEYMVNQQEPDLKAVDEPKPAKRESRPVRDEWVGAGRKLRAARVAAGLTQRELAQTLGVSQPSVSQWESGRVSLSAVVAHWLRQQEGGQ